MTGEVIKSFLVGLGFGVDDASLAKFNKAIDSAAIRVTALYASIKIAAAGIVFGISKISEGFEQMGYEYRIIAPAINKALVLRRELLKAYSTAGLNITKVIQSSVKLNLSLEKTKFAFKAIYDSVGSRFFELIRKNSDAFREKLYKNMPQIQNVLERLIKFVFKAVEATTALGVRLWSVLTRVYEFFAKLDEKTQGWSTKIIAVVAAWKLLNLSFLATPLGIILSLGLAILALYDDLKTFMEGGKSFINWGSDTTKIIVGIVGAVSALATGIYAVVLAMRAWAAIQAVLNALMLFNPIVLIIGAVVVLLALIAELTLRWGKLTEDIKSIGSFFGGIGGKILDFVSGGGVAGNLQNGMGGVPSSNPLGSNVQNYQTNQNVQQQTAITINGSADANAVGKAVAGEQSRVNFDMVRNMRGSVR